MNDDIKREILKLQERLKAGELTADEYMIAMTRLTDPEKATEMEGDLLLSQLPDYSFQDDDDEDDATTVTTSKNMAPVVILAVIVIFAIAIQLIVAVWAMILGSWGL